MAPRIRVPKQVSLLNLRSHSISTFNHYDRRILRILLLRPENSARGLQEIARDFQRIPGRAARADPSVRRRRRLAERALHAPAPTTESHCGGPGRRRCIARQINIADGTMRIEDLWDETSILYGVRVVILRILYDYAPSRFSAGFSEKSARDFSQLPRD